jgi:hypothetical protein
MKCKVPTTLGYLPALIIWKNTIEKKMIIHPRRAALALATIATLAPTILGDGSHGFRGGNKPQNERKMAVRRLYIHTHDLMHRLRTSHTFL